MKILNLDHISTACFAIEGNIFPDSRDLDMNILGEGEHYSAYQKREISKNTEREVRT